MFINQEYSSRHNNSEGLTYFMVDFGCLKVVFVDFRALDKTNQIKLRPESSLQCHFRSRGGAATVTP